MENEIFGFSMLTHDLTERKKAELSEKMEAKNKELEQITYIASHDLQEPLRTISGIVNIMNQQYMEQLDEDADKYLKFMKDASERMRNLIKGLLDYSRVGKGNELTYFDCKETISEIREDLAAFISESHSQIVIEGDLPYLRGYKTEFRLLLQNLISNAIKFRKKNVNPEIKISAVKEYNCWKFTIKDNGIGIEPKYQEKIFMIFQRLHNRSEYEGTGIGLSHCKKIVELHGGKIWVDSRLEHGSTFYFTIPNSIN
jgi:light-regulated signal transduction histidine kinase (bacteriophytochrome)